MVSTNCALLAILCTLAPLAAAQNFTVPKGWRVESFVHLLVLISLTQHSTEVEFLVTARSANAVSLCSGYHPLRSAL